MEPIKKTEHHPDVQNLEPDAKFDETREVLPLGNGRMPVKSDAVMFSIEKGTYGYWAAEGGEGGQLLLTHQQSSPPPVTADCLVQRFPLSSGFRNSHASWGSSPAFGVGDTFQ